MCREINGKISTAIRKQRKELLALVPIERGGLTKPGSAGEGGGHNNLNSSKREGTKNQGKGEIKCYVCDKGLA